MSDTTPIRYEQAIPEVFTALMALHRVVDTYGLDRTIHHLVLLRASQLNRCAHCIKMHLREAREHGETQERLDRVIVWDQVSDFSEREQVALAWTDALTQLDPKTDYGPLRARLRRHFDEAQIGALTTTVGMINFWNRLGVSRH